jgi:hypothetical protein
MESSSLNKVEAWLDGVTYRPGWKISCGGFVDGRQWIIIHATGPDVCEPGKLFKTGPLFKVPEDITKEQFYDWIIDECIPGIEQHERYEWFRINGHHHRNPHAPGMPAFAIKFDETPARVPTMNQVY